jgi:tetratricopeptide (TPR) repeat protein
VIILILGIVFLANLSFGSGELVRTEINLKTINSYIVDSPHDPNLYFVKGKILMDNNRIRKAKQTFEKVINMYPGYEEAYYELAKADFRLKDFDLALRNIEKYLLKNPDDVSAMFVKGEILIATEEYKQVLTIAEQILQIDDENGKAYLLKGESNFELGNYDTAYENWRISTNLGNVEAAVHLKCLFEPVW